MSTLEIKDLHVHVETKEGIKPILKGATLTVSPTRWPATPSTWSTPARPSSTARTSSR